MHRPPDDNNLDDWDGQDYAEESDPELQLGLREGQGCNGDIERQYPTIDHGAEKPIDYTGDWAGISRQRKVASGYKCSECGVMVLEQWDRLLHTHHINGIKNDNHIGNLRVMCVACHSKHHGFTVSGASEDDLAYLAKLKITQGLSG